MTHAKREFVRQYKKGFETDPFFSLLPAAKQRRVEEYKTISKVAKWLDEGREVVARPKSYWHCVLCITNCYSIQFVDVSTFFEPSANCESFIDGP